MDKLDEQDITGTWENVAFELNGEDVSALVPADRRLVSFLREDFGLRGTKVACEVGVCGACTVLVNGRPVSSCIALAVQVDGAQVTTVEGVADRPEMQKLLESFVVEGGYQCGFCTSGQVVTAASLLMNDPDSVADEHSRREYMQGNLCRCTGYYGIERALQRTTE